MNVRPGAARGSASPGLPQASRETALVKGLLMSRCYADPIEVRRRDDAPVEFIWRGRLYSVRAVLGHWLEAGGWWRHAVPDRGGVVDEAEQEVWRVEARRGRGGSPGVFDLRFDWSKNGWTLARALD